LIAASALGSISSRFRSLVVYPPPNVVWDKERGLTKRLEIEPTALAAINFYPACHLAAINITTENNTLAALAITFTFIRITRT